MPCSIVAPAPMAVPPSLHCAVDVRPGLGPLGALLTALASSDTPDVVLLGPRFVLGAAPAVASLIGAPRGADIVAAVIDGRRQPTFALYGHRCLGAIQASLLSGEFRMDRWWEALRVHTIDDSAWSRRQVPLTVE